jgi:hypothetical protein
MSGDKKKIDCIQLVYMPFYPSGKVLCGFSGVAYLKILVPEFLILKECIVGKRLV